MMKILRILGFLLFSFLVLIGIWWFIPERTPRIKTKNANSISSIDYIKIGGVEQCVLLRSKSKGNPIMLFLHGGPGMPMMYLAHEFQRPLEDDFLVVQWDRRGAGKTFSRNKPEAESMNVRRIIDDAYILIDTLKSRYNKDKIILVGHSFGTYIGSIMASERPELFSVYISIGQVVDDRKARHLQEKFIKEKASNAGRNDIIQALEESSNINLENWLFEYGGELKRSKSFLPLIWSGLQAPEYTLSEVINVAKGSSFSSTNMKYNVISGSIHQEITEYQMPVYFFIGKSDYTTPHELVTDYYELLNSTEKEIIYFEDSAHFPFFEEPERFCYEINRILYKN